MRSAEQIKNEAAALRRNLKATFPDRRDLDDLIDMSVRSKEHQLALGMVSGAIELYKADELPVFLKACKEDMWAELAQ